MAVRFRRGYLLENEFAAARDGTEEKNTEMLICGIRLSKESRYRLRDPYFSSVPFCRSYFIPSEPDSHEGHFQVAGAIFLILGPQTLFP